MGIRTSPVPDRSAIEAARRSVGFDGLSAGDGKLYWIASGGDLAEPAIVNWTAGQVAEALPFAVGNSVHAYGGGSFAVGGGRIWLSSPPEGNVWQAGAAHALLADGDYGDLSIGDGLLLSVRETPAGDHLVAVDIATERVHDLHHAAFLASPRFHAGHLAWIQWAEDTMPWDSSQLFVASFDGKSLSKPLRVAGGPSVSVTQPQWGPGGQLYFMSDETGWWNLCQWDARNGTRAVAPIEADCAAAPWELGYSSYTFLPNGRIAMITQNGPLHRLVTVAPGQHISDVPLPYTSIKPYLAAIGSSIAMIGSSPTTAQQVALISMDHPHDVQVVSGSTANASVQISVPEHIVMKLPEAPIHIFHYRPAGVGSNVAAPTVVRAHAGPTYQADVRLDWEVQYFTSRGFAVADVDYRGSTGYGREFRQALNGNWGIADVDDCHAAARHLVDIGLAQADALIIFGASAGGYTALRSASRPDSPFGLAVARSPVVNPVAWQRSAPRFQRPHAAALAHPNADVDPRTICRPIAIIHGVKDTVAPVSDTRRLAHALNEMGKEIDYLEIQGADHYLSGYALAQSLEFEIAAFRSVIVR